MKGLDARTRKYGIPLLFCLLFGSAYGQYTAKFIQPLPNGNPAGVTVDAENLKISVVENRKPETGEPSIVNDIVAKLDYTDTGAGTPSIGQIVNPNPPSLSIVKLEGVDGWEDGFYIKLNSELDFEKPDKEWGVQLNPAAPGLFSVAAVDVNDEFPIFKEFPQEPILIDENEDPTGKIYFTFEATDMDALDQGKLRFILEDLQDDTTPFRIDEITGDLSLVQTLDYETRTTHRLQVSVTDSDELHTVRAPIVTVIDVRDMNDQGPRWLKFPYRLDITENIEDADIPNGIYSAQDQDLGNKSEIVYSLDGVINNGDGIPYLEIDSESGQLKVKAKIDAEAEEIVDLSMDFLVIATELMEPKFSINESVSLRIRDQNDNLPLIDGGTTKLFDVTIPESHVGQLPSLESFKVVDLDVTLEFSRYTAEIVSEGRDWLTDALVLSPTSGSEETTFTISVNGDQIDYENPNWRDPVTFTVRITGTADPTHIAEALITLNVNDVNDCTPEFQNLVDDEIEFRVFENVTQNDPIGTVVALDDDISDEFGTKSIRYSWNKDAPSQLLLNEITGEVTVAQENAFDYERLNEMLYYIKASDKEGGAGSLQAIVILKISVLDVNDEAPNVNLPVRRVNIDENDKDIIVAENIQITDPDTDPDLSVTISSSTASSGDVSNWFEFTVVQAGPPMLINIIIGEETPDYEVAQQVDITITVVDQNTESSEYPSTTTAVLSVLINNLNDNDPVLDEPKNLKITERDAREEDCEEDCDDEALRYIYLFRATDPDFPSEPLRFSLRSNVSAMEDLVTLDETTGILSRAIGVDIDRDLSYIEGDTDGFTDNLWYFIKVSDEDDRFVELPIAIPVEDLNDNVPQWTFENKPYSFLEDVSPGFIVETVSATDRDATGTKFAEPSFFINTEYGGGIGADMFEMNRVTGELTVKQLLDREIRETYNLQLLVKDNFRDGTTTNSNENAVNIVITLIDVNNKSPVFSDESFESRNEDEAEPGTLLATVKVTDADKDDNAVVDVEILEVNCVRCNDNPEPILLFEGEFDRDTEIYNITSKLSFKTYFGVYNITLEAKDRGTPPKSTIEYFELSIIDINDKYPVIVYPEPELTFYIREGLGIGQQLVQWDGTEVGELIATDADDPDSPNGLFDFSLVSFPDDENDAASYFEVRLNNFLYVKKALDIDLNPYVFNVTVTDRGEPQKSDTETLTIKIVPDVNTEPKFETNELLIESFIENDASLKFQLEAATDADIIDDQNLFNETICYYIVRESETEIPFVLDLETNLLSLSEALDREEIAEYNFVVHAKNNLVNYCVLPVNPDLESESNIKVRILVGDVKDTAPEWPADFRPVISGGVRTTSEYEAKTSVILHATDADVNDTLTFSLSTTFDHSDSSLDPITTPFKLSPTNEILINFEPQQTMKGFFNFSVFVHDSVGMGDETQCKIYMVHDTNVVEFNFNNVFTEFDDEMRAALSQALTRVFAVYEPTFKCNIDEVQPFLDGNGVEVEGKTTVDTHFINSAKNEPVLRTVIQNLQLDQTELQGNLTRELLLIGLNLDLTSNNQDSRNDSDDILTYVLIAAVGVLAILLLVISATCWFNNKSLSRRVRALTATTFGSHQSGLDKAGIGMSLPNTNQHAIQGSNPIFSSKEAEARPRGIPDFDTESVGSGGSVLIGVEDDDDFRNYQENPVQDDNFQFGPPPSSGRIANPLFDGGEDDFDYLDTHSADNSDEFGQQELPPRSDANVVRRNPLMHMESFDA